MELTSGAWHHIVICISLMLSLSLLNVHHCQCQSMGSSLARVTSLSLHTFQLSSQLFIRTHQPPIADNFLSENRIHRNRPTNYYSSTVSALISLSQLPCECHPVFDGNCPFNVWRNKKLMSRLLLIPWSPHFRTTYLRLNRMLNKQLLVIVSQVSGTYICDTFGDTSVNKQLLVIVPQISGT